MHHTLNYNENVEITSENLFLKGKLMIPEESSQLIMFISDKASSRGDQLTTFLAAEMRAAGFATLEFDLLTEHELAEERKKLDINLLAERIVHARKWLGQNPHTEYFSIGIFAYNTGAAAALIAASRIDASVNAVVSAGGRPDLVLDHLEKLQCPVMLIAGGADNANVTFNQKALPHINSEHAFRVLQDAKHDFEQPGKREQVASLSRDWFIQNT
ncbi:MAG: dienelactone hydrolase family protein [Cyclobacteriaceae bacterium]